MNLYWIIYLADVIFQIKLGFILFGVIAIITYAIFLIADVLDYNSRYIKSHPNYVRKFYIFAAICGVGLLMPSAQSIYMMAGLNTVQNISATPEAIKVRKLINVGLDKAIDKLNESGE